VVDLTQAGYKLVGCGKSPDWFRCSVQSRVQPLRLE